MNLGEITDTDRETGSWFPVPPETDLPSDLRGLFAKARERLGFVPNVFRVYAYRPQRLSAWFSHYRQLHEPTDQLSTADREMIAVVVSAANGCLYCLVAHGAALRQELGDPVLGERISYDWRRAGLDRRRTAICAYAEKLTLRPTEVSHEDLETLLGSGLSLEEAWGRGRDHRHVQPHQPDGDGHQHAAQRGVQRPGAPRLSRALRMRRRRP